MSTSPDITIFHAWSYGRLKEIKNKLKKKKLHRTNQESNLLGSNFSNRDNGLAMA